MSGTLYVVATPIGNLDDLSPRARRTLEAVDLIAAEDTRRTGRLLSHFGLKTPLMAMHDHNETSLSGRLIEMLADGSTVALVSDAGTPLVSDPGYVLVRAALAGGVAVVPVPGACAAVAALSVAGLPTDRFCFEGFLPAKSKSRRDALARLAGEARTMVFYEAVHRIEPSIADMVAAFGAGREAFLGRELTKLHEQAATGTLAELHGRLAAGDIPKKGEFVVAVAGAAEAPGTAFDVDSLLLDLADRLPGRELARIVARATGLTSNALYRRLVELTKPPPG
jgi:16S rRNA (cytidine1402-2'-O)-methyltransferase